MSEHEQLVTRFRRRIALWMVLQSSVAALALWAFVWGTVILAFKAYQDSAFAAIVWGAAASPVVIGLAIRQALRRLPDRAAVRAMLDNRGGCGGLLMAGAERDLEGWNRTLPSFALPEVQWNARRPLLLLAIATGFAILAILVPGRSDIFADEAKLDIARETERITEQIRVLKEEKILDPDRAETLTQKLNEVRDQSAGKDPARTLEALDHLNEAVQQTAKQSAEAAAKQAKDLGKVQAGAEALQQAAASLDSQNLSALMKELSALAKKSNEESDKLNEGLDAELAEAIKEGKLSKEQLAKLAAAAKSGRDSIKKTAKKMFDSKLIDADQLSKCEGGDADGKGLAEYLKKNGGSGLEQAMKKKAQRGNGGISDDGPGETPLEFGDKSTADGAKFKEENLPPSDLKSLKDNIQSGVSTAVPKRDPKAGPPQTGSLNGAAVGGGSSNTAPVLPQHRAAVGRYFDRPMK